MYLARSTAHHLIDSFIGIGGIIACSLVIYLSSTKVKNKALRVYTIMLISNATVDLIYSINTLCTMCSGVLGIQTVFMTIDSPFWPKTVWWSYAAVSTNLFLMFLSVGILPLQFIYRYGTMRNQPFSRKQMLLFSLVPLAFALLHGFISPWTFRPPNPEYEVMFREALEVDENYELPGYLIGDVRNFDLMTLHFLNIFVIVAFSYATILFMAYLSKRTMTLQSGLSTSPQTKAVQRQVTRIIYIQAIYPLFVVCVPAISFSIAAARGIQLKMIGELVMFSMHTPPLVNSLIVILCVPSYRRFVVNPFKSDQIHSLGRLSVRSNGRLTTSSASGSARQ
ncbi:unnamed protein product [Bursaphelenchus xylophilus]|uniref:(pine wood nematode) hypothetical protein n=1 Tax=Bursaphelenchus xylophilus TaxID=6326 RepID=A0A1I7RXR5_BURXY|nr:unnamed protein product [Bursaphelenchus xylophilus]CAG9126677.1 unnamed protein product [Bursaphelenchus xylophilus]